MLPLIHLYFDVASPYSWIGFETACRYAKRWPIQFRLVPVLLGGIMKATGNVPPSTVPAKLRFMLQDLEHLGKHYHIPIKYNESVYDAMFVKGTLRAQRLLTSIALQCDKTKKSSSEPEPVISAAPGTLLETVARLLWLRIWSTGEDITTTESFTSVLSKLGLASGANKVGDLLELSSSPLVKDSLKSNTNRAIELGAFGLPMFHIQTSANWTMIFGSDRWHIIADLVDQPYLGPMKELSST